MLEALRHVHHDFRPNSAASDGALAAAENALRHSLSADHAAVLRAMNGGEGVIGDSYLRLWAAEDLAPLNGAYATADFLPGMLLIGSTGGGEAYAIDIRDPLFVYRVTFIPLHRSFALVAGTDLTDLVYRLAADVEGEVRPAMDEQRLGREIHETHPVMFGGDPVDPSNKQLLTPLEHAPFAVWWNRKYRELTRE